MAQPKLRVKAIKKIPAYTYETSDGETFVNKSEAQKHEKYLTYRDLREELVSMAKERFSAGLGLTDDGDEFMKGIEIGSWNIEMLEDFVDVVVDINTAINGDFKKFVDEVGELIDKE
ncbi:hypothetical protein LCGC14_1557080 [marine sediment metagenome]|uniref:Uncharacterized protein n=1 Tax=marine sediment metagenome TaxID=412755 RepID=A0A0F9LPG9_9ZZZZ